MKKTKQNRILIIAALIILILIIVGMAGKKESVPVTAEKVKLNTITEVIPANGKIQPVTEVKISPDVSGEIIELNVKEGDNVKRGDLIIKIKQDVYISMKERAEASLNAAKAQLDQQLAQFGQIEANYTRNKKLYDQKAISEKEYEDALYQYEIAKEQIRGARFNVNSYNAALKEANENLYKTSIYAPMDGIISKLSVEKGERVVGTSQMAGTEMFRIANFDEMEVLVDVNENDIIRIKDRDTAKIEVDAYPNRKFTGIVTQIANSAKNIGSSVDQVTNFEVKVLILSESYSDLMVDGKNPFRPGMSASVSIETATKHNVLTVPIQSITTRTDLLSDSLKNSLSVNESVENVFIVKNDTLQVRRITTGIQDLNNIEVVTGLEEGEMVVTGPFSGISKTFKSGLKVTIEDPNKNKKKKKGSEKK
jgi:HlyD family secretion protein